MRDSVRDAFVKFTEGCEGKCAWMYLDVRGLVTTGIGNLIDPVTLAMPLPWDRADGKPASGAEIAEEWHNVKQMQDMRTHGGFAFARVTKLRLDDAGIATLVEKRLDTNELYLVRRFPSWEQWPADAQLAWLSLAWAAGPAFNAPRLVMATNAQDWARCANECHLDDSHNPGLKPRNLANRQLFLNAASVVDLSLDRAVLYYPGEPTITSESGPDGDVGGPAA